MNGTAFLKKVISIFFNHASARGWITIFAIFLGHLWNWNASIFICCCNYPFTPISSSKLLLIFLKKQNLHVSNFRINQKDSQRPIDYVFPTLKKRIRTWRNLYTKYLLLPSSIHIRHTFKNSSTATMYLCHMSICESQIKSTKRSSVQNLRRICDIKAVNCHARQQQTFLFQRTIHLSAESDIVISTWASKMWSVGRVV